MLSAKDFEISQLTKLHDSYQLQTALQKHFCNRILIDRFFDFIKDSKLPKSEQLLILNEMGRMDDYNKKVKHMSKKEMQKPLDIVTVEIESNL